MSVRLSASGAKSSFCARSLARTKASIGVRTRAAFSNWGTAGRVMGLKDQNCRSSSVMKAPGASVAGSGFVALAPCATHCSRIVSSAGVSFLPFFGISPSRTTRTISLSSGLPATTT
jgi:hypothetical protein